MGARLLAFKNVLIFSFEFRIVTTEMPKISAICFCVILSPVSLQAIERVTAAKEGGDTLSFGHFLYGL